MCTLTCDCGGVTAIIILTKDIYVGTKSEIVQRFINLIFGLLEVATLQLYTYNTEYRAEINAEMYSSQLIMWALMSPILTSCQYFYLLKYSAGYTFNFWSDIFRKIKNGTITTYATIIYVYK